AASLASRTTSRRGTSSPRSNGTMPTSSPRTRRTTASSGPPEDSEREAGMFASRQTISRRPASCSNVAASTPVPSHRAAQRVGNQALQHLLGTRLVQAKLTVSRTDDAYEQAADRVADDVMRMPEPGGQGLGASGAQPRIQRLCPECEEQMQRKAPMED